jgi:hypothetical protein
MKESTMESLQPRTKKSSKARYKKDKMFMDTPQLQTPHLFSPYNGSHNTHLSRSPTSKTNLSYGPPPDSPTLTKNLEPSQVEHLLGRVGNFKSPIDLDNTFLSMATNDEELIELMKDTIDYQKNVIEKRERLVYAITRNVKYLAEIHTRNNEDLKNTRNDLDDQRKENARLKKEAETLKGEVGGLRRD